MVVLGDARGPASPHPVIRPCDAMREQGEVVALVSWSDEAEAVRRLGPNARRRISLQPRGDAYAMRPSKPPTAHQPTATPAEQGRGSVVVLSSDRMGRDDDTLEAFLVRSFLNTLGDAAGRPRTPVLYATGVGLAAEGPPASKELASLQAAGVGILLGGTCVDYSGLRGRLLVGSVSNMHAIFDLLLSADRATTV